MLITAENHTRQNDFRAPLGNTRSQKPVLGPWVVSCFMILRCFTWSLVSFVAAEYCRAH